MGDETMEHKVTFHIDENARRSLLLEMRTIFSALPQIYT